jgi:soluble lytic murein transglycosylase
MTQQPNKASSSAKFRAMPRVAPLTVPFMKRRIVAITGLVLAAAALAAGPKPMARAQGNGNGLKNEDIVVQAREAFRVKDRARLAGLRQTATAMNHPLAAWVEYWELANRLADTQQGEFDAFAERWRGSYVEDRLRNDWLLELGRRRDWDNLRNEYPRFRMNDDREVICYVLWAQHAQGQEVRAAARAAWIAQREFDEGCHSFAQALLQAKVFGVEELWPALRAAAEAGRARLARERAALIDAQHAAAVDAIFKDAGRVLRERRGQRGGPGHDALTVLALWRAAAADPDLAFSHLDQHYAARLPANHLAQAWAGVARYAAMKQHPQAAEWARNAWVAFDKAGGPGSQATPFSDEALAWMVRAALRAPASFKGRWTQVLRGVDAMSAAEQHEPAWLYWRARALAAEAKRGSEGDSTRALAKMTLESIAGPFGFYGQLAQEALGRRYQLPASAAAPRVSERAEALAVPGLQRALALVQLGLRGEAAREWNFTLRGLHERELHAIAHMACEREVWDRCISTSERTRQEVDAALRYPMPLREQLAARAQAAGLDEALVYGLIRQESRFIIDARSPVGASGLMQLMPGTARWTARKVGLDWRPDLVNDTDINLQLGTTYLRLVLDDFGGALPLAAAAYNAGPARARRWREGNAVEAAAWIEGIPFNETRDYVKKVLSNAVVYAARLGEPNPSLRARLGGPIGPRDPAAPAENRELP